MITIENNKYPLKLNGTIMQDGSNLRIIYSNDLINYYLWHIENYYQFSINTPAHGSHTTIVSSKLHPSISKDALKKYHGKKITIFYDPHIRMGGQTKNFRNFYIKIYSDELNSIAKEIGVLPAKIGWHITIANTKSGIRPFFKKLISLKK